MFEKQRVLARQPQVGRPYGHADFLEKLARCRFARVFVAADETAGKNVARPVTGFNQEEPAAAPERDGRPVGLWSPHEPPRARAPVRDAVAEADERVHAPGALYDTAFLRAATLSSGLMSGVVVERTAPEPLTARLRASPAVASGRSTTTTASWTPYAKYHASTFPPSPSTSFFTAARRALPPSLVSFREPSAVYAAVTMSFAI